MRHDYHAAASRRPCRQCGTPHSFRWRRPGWCLPCDLVDRKRARWSSYRIAEYVDLPVALVAIWLHECGQDLDAPPHDG